MVKNYTPNRYAWLSPLSHFAVDNRSRYEIRVEQDVQGQTTRTCKLSITAPSPMTSCIADWRIAIWIGPSRDSSSARFDIAGENKYQRSEHRYQDGETNSTVQNRMDKADSITSPTISVSWVEFENHVNSKSTVLLPESTFKPIRWRRLKETTSKIALWKRIAQLRLPITNGKEEIVF